MVPYLVTFADLHLEVPGAVVCVSKPYANVDIIAAAQQVYLSTGYSCPLAAESSDLSVVSSSTREST
jgi:hypothetical protein